MLWGELLAGEGIARMVMTRDKEPILSRLRTDIRLLAELVEGQTEIQEHSPVYPWLFWPTARGSTFEYIGTDSRDVALKMVLWSASVHEFSGAGKTDATSAEYKKRLVRSFQLAVIAELVGTDNIQREYNAPMVTMHFKSVVGLMLEITAYAHETSNRADPTTMRGMQRCIGELIRDIRTGTGLPKAWTTQLTRIQEWHRHELALLEATGLKATISDVDAHPPSKVAETYLEIEALLTGCKETESALGREVHHDLHTVGWKTSASGYTPTCWTAITLGTIYDKLPCRESWTQRCESTRYFDQAYELFPELKRACPLPRPSGDRARLRLT